MTAPRRSTPMILRAACALMAAAALWAMPHGAAQAQSRPLSLLTWNMEWLIAPADERELRARCQRQQPRSDERAIPCTPG
ncbi:MAG: hypothetical protein WAQ08_14675, partial [Aquabacterium sp.]|uniref:hypothetical protein n=1 Tax=Aquabacterium sp. TaxID=1872578 RepID=UPI003BAFF146